MMNNNFMSTVYMILIVFFFVAIGYAIIEKGGKDYNWDAMPYSSEICDVAIIHGGFRYDTTVAFFMNMSDEKRTVSLKQDQYWLGLDGPRWTVALDTGHYHQRRIEKTAIFYVYQDDKLCGAVAVGFNLGENDDE